MPSLHISKPAYLVVLRGGGDTYAAIVTHEVWEWMHADPPAFVDHVATEGRGVVPDRVIDAMEADAKTYPESFQAATDVDVTSGSYQNDRAMAAVTFGALHMDDTARDAQRWAAANGYDILDTFMGAFY